MHRLHANKNRFIITFVITFKFGVQNAYIEINPNW